MAPNAIPADAKNVIPGRTTLTRFDYQEERMFAALLYGALPKDVVTPPYGSFKWLDPNTYTKPEKITVRWACEIGVAALLGELERVRIVRVEIKYVGLSCSRRTTKLTAL